VPVKFRPFSLNYRTAAAGIKRSFSAQQLILVKFHALDQRKIHDITQLKE
jgi:hypothetical protein